MPARTQIQGSARYEHEVKAYAKMCPEMHDVTTGSDGLHPFSSSIEDVRQQLAEARAETERLRAHHLAAELELNVMRRIFVVLSQIHLADSEYNAMSIVHDVLTNFVGTEEFGCVLFDTPSHHIVLSMGTSDARIHGLVGRSGSPFEQLMRQGRLVSKESLPLERRDYLVAFPLMEKSAVVGAVVIFRLLTQKNGIERLDRALFDLLTRHAAPAFAKHTGHAPKEQQQ